MEPTDFHPLLASATAEVLESMCFMSADENCSEPIAEDETWIAAKLHFRGPSSGDFGLRTPLGTARTIASNFLGEDESDLNTFQVIEVLCELSNMICGALLGRLGSDGVYDLSHPERDLGLVRQEANSACRTLQLDGGALSVWLNLEPTP